VESLLEAFEYSSLHFEGGADDYYHPGRSARAVMDGAHVAQFGQLHPEITQARKLRQDVYLAEIYLDRLYTRPLRAVRYEPLPRFPGVERDFSFIFPEEVVFEKLQKTVAALNISEMQSFVPAEVFRGGSVPAGKYSLLLRAKFQSNERTLREEEVAQWSAQIVRALESVGGEQRA
jgi:phenylalanyl-tRNA synthetase beta chain